MFKSIPEVCDHVLLDLKFEMEHSVQNILFKSWVS